MSLRLRLLLSTLLIGGIGLAAMNVAVAGLVRRSLQDRLDAELRELGGRRLPRGLAAGRDPGARAAALLAAASRVEPEAPSTTEPGPRDDGDGPVGASRGRGGRLGFGEVYLEVRDGTGRLIGSPQVLGPVGDTSELRLDLPEVLGAPPAGGRFLDAHPVEGSGDHAGDHDRFRVLYRPLPERRAAPAAITTLPDPGPGSPGTGGADGGADGAGVPSFVVTAISARNVDRTMGQLRLIQLGAAVAVLAATAGGALALVHWSLRPLRRMEAAARAIAAGDLEHPIADERSTTEVGRLGSALHSMMEQIRASFAEQERAQSKLRRFLADASHELRTPITSVRGYAQLHQRTRSGADPETDRIMERIEGAGVRMGSLVEDLLTLSRDGQVGPPRDEPVEVGEVVRAVVDDARAGAPGRELTVRVSDDPVVSGDPDRLHRAVANLVANALQHTSGAVEVEAGVVDAEVRVAVVDHGPGIAPEHLPHLFDPFFRADPSRSRDSGGAGLGLAIVSAIASSHGGRVEVDSRPGTGSRFVLHLPRLGG